VRREFRWALAAGVAFALGLVFAESYARMMVPYYLVVDRIIASGHPWQITSIQVHRRESAPGEELQMWASVSREVQDPDPAATVRSRVQVGEVVETPIVFWTLLLMWPAESVRKRLLRMAIGLPVFLGLEAITTATQLVLPMAQASAILAGEDNPVTAWDHWSHFLEAGGQFAIIIGAAMIPVALTRTSRAPARLQTET
jgi:hypothetical protein